MYEDNKFKGCGKESSVQYSAHAFINNASTDILYHCSDIVKRSVMTNGQQFYVYVCKRSVPAWTGNIATINYVKGYKKDCRYECSNEKYNCYYCSTTMQRCCSNRTVCANKCYTVPEYEDCMPKTASESMWYGQTVFTNYENCQKNFGSFLL